MPPTTHATRGWRPTFQKSVFDSTILPVEATNTQIPSTVWGSLRIKTYWSLNTSTNYNDGGCGGGDTGQSKGHVYFARGAVYGQNVNEACPTWKGCQQSSGQVWPAPGSNHTNLTEPIHNSQPILCLRLITMIFPPRVFPLYSRIVFNDIYYLYLSIYEQQGFKYLLAHLPLSVTLPYLNAHVMWRMYHLK